MIRLRPSGVDEILIKRVQDWYEPGPGVFIEPQSLFSPAMLFTGTTQGAWYDPSDTTTLFQNAAGTLPVTAVEQPVGLMLDKSKGLVLGPELSLNPDFNSSADWFLAGTGWSISSGALVGASPSGFAKIINAGTPQAGKFFKVTITVRLRSSGGVQPRINGSTGTPITGSPNTYSWIVLSGAISGGATDGFQIIGAGPFVGEIESISFKELPGNHAFNSSGNSANFPVLSARYNQYLSTETLVTQNVTTVAASYKLAFTGTGSITLSGTATGTYSAGTHTITCTAGTLTSTVSGTVTQADLRVANDALNQPAYQRVNTATDYDTVGFKPAEVFDGVDDNLIASAGGGSTTAFFWCSAIRVGKVGAVQTLFSDAGTNTGYRVRINASNQLELSAGNGTAYTTVATTATLSIGQRAVLTAWHDGTNLNVQINNGTVHQAAFATATAGTAQFTIGKDNNAASNFFAGRLYENVYTKDNVPSSAQITSTKTYVANVAGITLS